MWSIGKIWWQSVDSFQDKVGFLQEKLFIHQNTFVFMEDNNPNTLEIYESTFSMQILLIRWEYNDYVMHDCRLFLRVSSYTNLSCQFYKF